jgi:hypothetical protein
MAFYIGTNKVIEDTDASAGISTSSDLDKLQINGTDVLTHDGSTITLKNVNINDAIESSIDTDNLTEGSTNLFYTSARQSAMETYTDTAEALAISTSNNYTDTQILTVLPLSGGTLTGLLTLSGAPTNALHATTKSYVDSAVTSGTGGLDTDDVVEGSTNLYYTDARALSATDGEKVLFANVYSLEGDLPSATTYHGMFAHVHDTGKGYFAHGGAWRKLLDETSSTTTDLTEGSNLYYTDARVNALLSGGGGTTYATQTYVDTAETDANTYTDTAIANLVDTAPATLDTLNELAAALGDDPNFATTVTNQIAAITHDGFADFVANEHIDWTAASAGTIDPTNYTNTGDTTYTAGNGLTLTGTEFTMSGSYTGDFTATGDVTAYSDERLKRNIETISNPIDLVNCLRGVNFEKDGRHSTGVIAQEVEEFLPEVVHTNAEGMKSVAYGNIAGLLIEAIKEQQQTIENLQKQISDIQSSKE